MLLISLRKRVKESYCKGEESVSFVEVLGNTLEHGTGNGTKREKEGTIR